MEACGGAHWLAPKLNAMGYHAELISAQYVWPFVKSHKNDYIPDWLTVHDTACTNMNPNSCVEVRIAANLLSWNIPDNSYGDKLPINLHLGQTVSVQRAREF
ncbi:hypothetical protein HDG38_003751 [Paraburkholderia sp. WSM4177]|nr:hypothetical protein [Paraburkholderia sp. WSM4177]MBB5485670.1 hypothetical protein [Paraburkholderia sp. WSM4180]